MGTGEVRRQTLEDQEPNAPDGSPAVPDPSQWRRLTWEQWGVIGILGLAGGARLTGLDLGWFMVDQARDAVEASRIAAGENFPLVGPVAPGLYALGPLYYYLLAIPFRFSQDPAAAVFFLSCLNLISVYVAYRLGSEFFSVHVGLTAAALYAVFPMAIVSTKAMWNPGFIPFFSSIFFYGLFRFLVAGRPWGLALALVALGCLLQVHLSGLACLILLCLAMALFRPSLPWRQALIGCALVLALFSSYLVFEANRGFEGFFEGLRYAQAHGTSEQSQFSLGLMWRAAHMPFTVPLQMDRAFSPEGRLSLFTTFQGLTLVLFVCGLFWMVYRILRHWHQRRELPRHYLLLLLWIVIPLLTLTQKKDSVFWYYFDVLYPSQFLLIGIFVDDLLKALADRKPVKHWVPAAGSVAALVIGVIVLVQASFVYNLQRYVINTGFLPLPTDISLRFPDPVWAITEPSMLRLMPSRYKKALTAAVLDEAPMDEATFLRHIHGATFDDVLEDKGYFFSVSQRQGAYDHSDMHYVMARQQDWPGALQGIRKQVGPFEVLRYRPAVQHAAWKYTTEPGPQWYAADYDDAAWTVRPLPPRNLPNRAAYLLTPFAHWGEFPIYCRGWLRAEGDVEHLHLVVSLRESPVPAHRRGISAIYINGQPLRPIHAYAYVTPLTRSAEVVFDIAQSVTPGLNLVAFEVEGTFPAFDLDVYDIRWQREDQR